MKLKNTLLGLALCAFAATSLASSGLEGQQAPDFALKSSTGDNLRLSEYRGDVVMINFWASWCAPCREEMPLLDEMYDKYKNLGFTILGVNLDENRQDAAKILEQIPVTFPVLFDPKSEISRLYKVTAMPTTILIDRDGNLRAVHKGYLPGFIDKYDSAVKALIKE